MQLDHYTSIFKKRKFPITIICDNVINAQNIGSLLRASDAFGIEKIYFCGSNIPIGRKMTKTSRATEKVVDFEVAENAFNIIKEFKNKGFQIIALEITSNSKAITEVSFTNHQPIILVIGDENFGISDDILKLSDNTIHINMYGQNSSMNVVQATTIALYEITKQIM